MWSREPGFHIHDVYQYYLGAKYFPELGYHDLYRCSLAALSAGTGQKSLEKLEVRDLRHNAFVRFGEIAPRGRRCDGAFEAQRWRQFQADIAWFVTRMGPTSFPIVLKDYGYNPSPVWTLVGRPIALLVPASDLSLKILARADLLLLLVAFAFAGRAFGFEGLCLAVMAWGLNPLSRYQWIGDAFLRQFWFATAIIGIACLRQRRNAAAGALLGVSSLLRLFPASFALVYAVSELRRALRDRRSPAGFARFALAAGITSLLLIGAATSVSGRGPHVYVEFFDNMRAFPQANFWRGVGLQSMLTVSSERPRLASGAIDEHAMRASTGRLLEERAPYYFAVVAGFLALLFRATRDTEGWEAACLGFVLVLVFTRAPPYYMSCVVPAAFLGTRRPRIAVALMLALGGWCAANLVFFDDQVEYILASAIGLAFAFYVLLEMRRPAVGGAEIPPS